MKRFNKSAIAVAMAGTLALGAAPMAGAATPATLQPGDLVYDSAGNIVTSFSGTTDGLVVLEDGDVVYDSNSQNVTADRSATAPAAPDAPAAPAAPVQQNTRATLQQGDVVFNAEGEKVISFSDTTDGLVNLEAGDVVNDAAGTDVTADRTANTPDTLENTDPIPVTLEEGDLIYDAEGNIVSSYSMTDNGRAVLRYGDTVLNKDSENVTAIRTGNAATSENDSRPVTLNWGDLVVDKDGNVVLTAKENGELAVLQPGDKVVPAGKIGAGVLGGLAVVTLGGILYNVVKNAQGDDVLVPADRPDQTPTAEDEKKTQELVQAHADEIAAQAAQQNEGSDALRGVGANTGNNAIGKGLMALVMASVLAAAAFVFGRRQLV